MEIDLSKYKQIPSFPNYYVDENSNVLNHKGHLMTPWSDKKGYLYLGLRKNNKKYNRGIHQLVCEAFHGIKPIDKQLVAHNNGIKLDNRPSNLRWATVKENSADTILHGNDIKGSKNGVSKLTEDQVIRLKTAYASLNSDKLPKGFTSKFAKEYGVDYRNIWAIIRGVSWTHIKV